MAADGQDPIPTTARPSSSATDSNSTAAHANGSAFANTEFDEAPVFDDNGSVDDILNTGNGSMDSLDDIDALLGDAFAPPTKKSQTRNKRGSASKAASTSLDTAAAASNGSSQTKSPSGSDKRAVSNFRLSPETVSRLSANDITQFTEVQAGTFDLIFDGKDIIAKSRTGTGKTLAFALPILERLAAASSRTTRQRGAPRCIVLAPTRELAKQVAKEMSNIGGGLGLTVECFYGGSSYTPQENALRRGFDVLVGTPGRIMDHLDRGTLRMNNVEFAVLDEADEMLSMGFAQDVERVFRDMPPADERQIILFSATVPSWVKGLAAQFQRPGVVTFDAVSTGSMAATTVTHCAVRVPEREEARAGLLADIIAVHSSTKAQKQLEKLQKSASDEDKIYNAEEERSTISSDSQSLDSDFDALMFNVSSADSSTPESIGPSRAIVFTETKREADELATSGALDGCGAAVLHGDVTQRQREITLSQFRAGQLQVLVATDVAARGLDISGVDVVVQYRVPRESEAYIHRAGRTGRAGKTGTAVVLYSDRETNRLAMLERECRIKFVHEAAPAPELALDAAVDLALANVRCVEPRVRKHLIARAQRIVDFDTNNADIEPLDEEDKRMRQIDLVAGLLAMAGRRTQLADRSVLSGESGMRTLHVQKRQQSQHEHDGQRDGRDDMQVGKAMRFINEIGGVVGLEGRIDVGLIRICRDGSAVADVTSAHAEKLLDAWAQLIEDGQAKRFDVTLALATRVPALKDQSQPRGGRGGGGYARRGGGGGNWRDRDGNGGNNYRRGGRDSYGSGGGGGGDWRRNDRGGGQGRRDRSFGDSGGRAGGRNRNGGGGNGGYYGGGGGGGRRGGGGGGGRRGSGGGGDWMDDF